MIIAASVTMTVSYALERYDFSDEGELSDDEVSFLNAAGTATTDPRTDKEKRL